MSKQTANGRRTHLPPSEPRHSSVCPSERVVTQFNCVMMLLLVQEAHGAHGERTLLSPPEADGGLRGEEMTYRFKKKTNKEVKKTEGH